MKILALDTSTKTMCVGISDGQKAWEHDVEYATGLSCCCVPAVGRILAALGWKASDVDLFACGLGPGSFTGIRIGMACIKGLAWATAKPVCGVPTLDTIAMNAGGEAENCVVAMDAKRGLFYCSSYTVRQGKLTRCMPYLLLNAHDLLKAVGKKFKRLDQVSLLGDGIPLLKQQLAGTGFGSLRLLDSDYWRPRGHNCVALAQRLAKEKKNISDTFRIEPIYLYPKECQIR
jgi:tRNA threonylcarbamoyladenosine biosynthesis protein TsaB